MKTQKPIEREPIAQPVSTSLIDVVFPGHSNHHGTLFGGAAFALMDRVAFISATRFGRVPFVTASCERIDFKWPVRIGQIVEATARPLWAGRKTLTIEVELIAENLLGGERRTCTRGLFNMVAAIGQDVPSDWALATLPRRGGYQAREGETVMTEIVFADQSNASGNMFGGEAIAAMTKAAFVCATRHCRMPTVVAASDEVHFHHPVKVGSIIELVAHISRRGNRSMVVAVQLWEEGVLSGKRSMAAESRFTMVATKVGDAPESLAL
ncbi:acyl-CoA thioesterase [Rhizobium sp. C1]|uniref:acyl-CoA thioesterase n=1 Tax=Rhizobium sp. C1 TaxID=1349799 RepID=UPI001E3EEA51|nr:hotdog domain-containing protein [Rhizobium sp. C1]MCD2179467.1 acyl-CoA thioesterase [Rhizobium sp. C1]